MTPEEIAREIIGATPTRLDVSDWHTLRRAIAVALQSYGAECAARERERCAQELADLAQWYADNGGITEASHVLRRASRILKDPNALS